MINRLFLNPLFWEGMDIDLPTYAEVIEQFPDRGFPGLDINSDRYPTLTAKREELERRFYARYCERIIGYETIELWQIKLQNRFDDIADEYERAFRIYETNKDAMDKAVEGIHRTVESKSRSIDTPDSDLNDDDRYADTLGKSTQDATESVMGGRAVKSVNENIDAYRDYESRFLMEFENLFNNVLGD